jgi:hypothetical protein
MGFFVLRKDVVLQMTGSATLDQQKRFAKKALERI